MSFVETTRGNLINVDHIVMVEPDANGKTCKLVGVGDERLGDIDWTDYEKLKCNLIPAQPGWFLLHHYSGDQPDTYWREDIIAWDVGDFGVYAVGLETSTRKLQTILSPDGRVTQPDMLSWATTEDWVNWNKKYNTPKPQGE